MDRIDAMKVFVAALDEGSLAGAARKLGRSAAAVSRAVAFLENHVGVQLLHRTTRLIKLSEAGERYAAACRRMLTDLEEADILAAGERSAPRGTLTVTAPVISDEQVLPPILDDFLDAYPMVSANLYVLDRFVNLIDEGIDAALRIAHLPDSSMVSVRVGEVRRVITAAPSYLAKHPRILEPGDLANQQIISMNYFGLDSWSFPPASGSTIPRTVQFTPRFVVNGVRVAVASAVEGHGVTRLFSLPGRRACTGGPAADRAEIRRARALAGQCRHAGGPALCLECAPSWTSSCRVCGDSSRALPRIPERNPYSGARRHGRSSQSTVRSYLLRALHSAVRCDRGDRERPLYAPRARSRTPHRPGALCQGPCRAGARLPSGTADAAAAPHPSQGRS